jgi:HK97 family phage portal protein
MLADRFARAVRAETFDGGPMPAAGVRGSLSGSLTLGPQGLDLVPTRGESVWATFRTIYLTNPWAWACVNLIAGTIARMPLEVYGVDPESGDPELQRPDWPVTPGRMTGGQALAQRLNHPLGGISRQALVRRTIIDRLVLGNGLWEIVENPRAGLPLGVQSIPWRAVRDVIEGEDGLPVFYKVAADLSRRGINGTRTRNISAGDVVHFGRGADPELPVGVSPLASCRNTIRLHDAVMRSLVGWFTNSMRPSAHISVEKLTRDKAREIREMIVEAYASPENAGKVLVTSGKWESAQGPLSEQQVVELLHESREELVAAYKIPPPVAGILDKAIKSNVVELRSQYIRDTVGDHTDDMEGDIQAQLLPAAPSWESLDVCFNMEAQLRPDLEALAIALEQLGDTLSVDDRREILGRKPFRTTWSKVPWSKPGAMPLDKAYTAPAPGAGSVDALALEAERKARRDEQRLAAHEDEPEEEVA